MANGSTNHLLFYSQCKTNIHSLPLCFQLHHVLRKISGCTDAQCSTRWAFSPWNNTDIKSLCHQKSYTKALKCCNHDHLTDSVKLQTGVTFHHQPAPMDRWTIATGLHAIRPVFTTSWQGDLIPVTDSHWSKHGPVTYRALSRRNGKF